MLVSIKDKIKILKFILFLICGVLFLGSPAISFKMSYYTFAYAMLDIQNGRLNSAMEKLELTIKLDKTALEAYKQLLYLNILAKNSDKIKSLVSNIIQLEEDEDSIINTANLLLSYGYLEEAKRLFSKTEKSNPKNKDAILSLAQINFSSNTKESINLYSRYLDIQPQDLDTLFQLGVAEYKRGNIQAAIELFKKVVNLSEENDTAKLILADLLSVTTNYMQAEKIYLEHLDKNRDDLDTVLKLMILYLTSQKIDEVEKYVKQLETVDEKKFLPEYAYYIAIYYEYKKDFILAAKYMRKYVDLTKKVPLNPYLKLGYYYSMTKQFYDSEKNLMIAIKKFDSFEAKVILSFVYMDQKKYKSAIRILLDLENGLPIYERVYFYLGYCYDQIGKFDIAEKYFIESIKKYPKDHETMNYLGYSYADKNIKLDEAEKLIVNALELDPENVAYIDSLSWVYFRKGYYAEAEKLLEKISAKTVDPVIFEHLAEVKEKLNKTDESLKYYNKVLELDPKNIKIKNKLKSRGKK